MFLEFINITFKYTDIKHVTNFQTKFCLCANSQTYVLITGEPQYLKKTRFANDDCYQLPIQTRYIEVLGTFDVSLPTLKLIFQHAKDRVLDAVVVANECTIFSDNEVVLYKCYVAVDNMERNGIILQGSKTRLQDNGLEYF